jgi:hypothetical protein
MLTNRLTGTTKATATTAPNIRPGIPNHRPGPHPQPYLPAIPIRPRSGDPLLSC